MDSGVGMRPRDPHAVHDDNQMRLNSGYAARLHRRQEVAILRFGAGPDDDHHQDDQASLKDRQRQLRHSKTRVQRFPAFSSTTRAVATSRWAGCTSSELTRFLRMCCPED